MLSTGTTTGNDSRGELAFLRTPPAVSFQRMMKARKKSADVAYGVTPAFRVLEMLKGRRGSV